MKADDWVGLMLNRLARKRLFLPSDRGVGFGTRLEKVSKHSPNYTVNLQTLLSLRENDEYTQLNLFRWLREVNSFSKKIISDINDCINNLDSFGAPCPASHVLTLELFFCCCCLCARVFLCQTYQGQSCGSQPLSLCLPALPLHVVFTPFPHLPKHFYSIK